MGFIDNHPPFPWIETAPDCSSIFGNHIPIHPKVINKLANSVNIDWRGY